MVLAHSLFEVFTQSAISISTELYTLAFTCSLSIYDSACEDWSEKFIFTSSCDYFFVSSFLLVQKISRTFYYI